MYVLQEEEAVQVGEAVQEEELQEEDQQVIETWTHIKACTCDCESAESPTRIPAVIPPDLPTSLPPPPPPRGHSQNCMPGEDSAQVT